MIGRWIASRYGTLNASGRTRWRAASSLPDLGELTGAWLAGQIGTQPGYYGPVDVDEDDAPGLTATLIALNRAGFVTRCSQAGAEEYDGWAQHAAVQGYADLETARRLYQGLAGTRHQLRAQPVRARFTRPSPGIAVTYLHGQPYTWFGRSSSAGEIGFDLAGVGRSAVTAARKALQVTIWDPTIGANDLWPALWSAVEPDLPFPTGSTGTPPHLREALLNLDDEGASFIDGLATLDSPELVERLRAISPETLDRMHTYRARIQQSPRTSGGSAPSLTADSGLSADGDR